MYFIRVHDDGSCSIVARYDDGIVPKISRAEAEVELLLATGEVHYEKRQLEFEL